MAEHYLFFDSTADDERWYDAGEFTKYFHTLVTTGIMRGKDEELEVTASGSNLITTQKTGIAFVEGKYYENDAPKDFTHDPEGLGQNRIDRIVVRLDLSTSNRYVRSFIKKGTPSTNPQPPALQRDNTIYEISLAQVPITGGQSYIDASSIIDERGIDNVCPWAGSYILPNFDDQMLEDFINEFNAFVASKGQVNGITPLNASGVIDLQYLSEVPLPQDATTNQKGIVQLSNSLTSTSQTLAATAYALKQVNDKLIGTSVVIGNGATGATESVVIGRSAKANGTRALALGTGAEADGWGAAIGAYSFASGDNQGRIGVEENNSNGPRHWVVEGSFAVGGTKNFEINHPHPDKKETHKLRHGAVESPTPGENLYRYEVEAIQDGETVELQLPDYFKYLNINVDVHVSPHMHYGNGYGYVEGNILKVSCKEAGKYKVLVIGTRNDDNVQSWYIKGEERHIGESWEGETLAVQVPEIVDMDEIKEG